MRQDMTTGTAATPLSIVRTYLAVSGLFTLAPSVIWGVNALFLLDAGLDIFEVFLVNAAFTSGAVEAWLVDALAATGHQGPLERVLAGGQMVSGVAMLLGSVGGGVLGNLDLTWPFLVRALLLVAVFAVGSRAVHDVGFTPRTTSLVAMPREVRQVLHASLAFGWRARPVRLLMLVSLVQGLFTMWSWSAWQPYLLGLLGRDAVWVAGVVAALTALATIAGNALVETLTRLCGRRTTLLMAGMVVLAAGAVGVGLSGSFWPAMLLVLALSAAEGVAAPVQQAYLHQVVPSAQRATVVSSVSLVSSASGIGGQLGLGWIARAQSIATGYVAGGLVLLLRLPPLLLLRSMLAPADRIVGTAGTTGPCAGQGLPVVASVDTLPRHSTPAEDHTRHLHLRVTPDGDTQWMTAGAGLSFCFARMRR